MKEPRPEWKRPPHLWKPGQSGNPKGRPRKNIPTIAGMLRDIGSERVKVRNGETTRMEQLLRRMFELAEAGDPSFAKLLLGYAFGPPEFKVRQTVAVQISSGDPAEEGGDEAIEAAREAVVAALNPRLEIVGDEEAEA